MSNSLFPDPEHSDIERFFAAKPSLVVRIGISVIAFVLLLLLAWIVHSIQPFLQHR